MSLTPRVVVVHRRTEYDELVAAHGTRGQAAFFLSTRGRDIAELEERHRQAQLALETVAAQIPVDWRRGSVERADVSRFLFSPDDVVVVVGQDGLVANVAKYLDGQPVIGIDPEPGGTPVCWSPTPRATSGRCCAVRTASPSARWCGPSSTTASSSSPSTRSTSGTPATRPPATTCGRPRRRGSRRRHQG